VQPEHVHEVMRRRSNNPLFLIDIGVPRNIHPASRKIENVFLYDMDALRSIVDRNLERRMAELPRVDSIVQEETEEFFRWAAGLQAGPTIQEFRDSLEGIRRQEVEKNINRFKPEDRDLVELVTRRIVNKILHGPTEVLKQGDAQTDRDTAARILALRELFRLSSNGSEPHES
jgi:glutamyl-tRNA reductase